MTRPTVEEMSKFSALPDEDVAKQFREAKVAVDQAINELKRRGYSIDLRAKVPSIKKTVTMTTQL